MASHIIIKKYNNKPFIYGTYTSMQESENELRTLKQRIFKKGFPFVSLPCGFGPEGYEFTEVAVKCKSDDDINRRGRHISIYVCNNDKTADLLMKK